MINTSDFGKDLKTLGYDFYTGVPCSFLKNLINYAVNDCEYIAAVNEGDAVAIAAGAYLGGRKTVVLMQNSGLTNATSPLTSLNFPFKIPVLGFVSLRGELGLKDQPQHVLMGQITGELLNTMRIKWEYLPDSIDEAKKAIKKADEYISNTSEPFFFVVKKNTFEKVELKNQKEINNDDKKVILQNNSDSTPSRYEALKVVNELKDDNTIQLATTGKTGRELFTIEDAENNLYMVGSMGCVSSLGLGIAIARNDKDVIVLDGDGSLLMRMGSLSVNAYYKPENMLHIVFDNGTYDSTGGQRTVAGVVDFVGAASACGYPVSIYAHNLDELKMEISNWKKNKKLTFLYIKISEGSLEDLGRPDSTPEEVKYRLLDFLR